MACKTKSAKNIIGSKINLSKESFGKMFSTFLHELSHALGGYDGDRSFSDCLTVLIQKCIDNNSSVKKYGNQWSKLIN